MRAAGDSPPFAVKQSAEKVDSSSMEQVLLLEDDECFREYLESLLLSAGHCVVAVGSVHDAFEQLHREHFDVIVMDLHLPFTLDERMPEFQYSIEVGVRSLLEFRWALPETRIIAMTATLPSEIRGLNEEGAAVPVLYKPFSAAQLLSIISPSTGRQSTEVRDTCH